MSEKIKNNLKYPRKCKVCGLGEVEHEYAVCKVCGWEDDAVQNDEPNFAGGANDMSLNQYKQFWKENKEDILKNHQNELFYIFDKADNVYKENFEEANLEYFRSIDPEYDVKMQQVEENRRKIELERQQEESKRKDNNSES